MYSPDNDQETDHYAGPMKDARHRQYALSAWFARATVAPQRASYIVTKLAITKLAITKLAITKVAFGALAPGASHPPRHHDGDQAQDRQDRPPIGPWHLIDHEAAGRIGKIAGPLPDPNQADQDGENAGDQKCDFHCGNPIECKTVRHSTRSCDSFWSKMGASSRGFCARSSRSVIAEARRVASRRMRPARHRHSAERGRARWFVWFEVESRYRAARYPSGGIKSK
jgi:hypothetical protein